MSPSEKTVMLKESDMKGSRARCLILTSMPRTEVADFLNRLVSPYADVGPDDVWMPNGFIEPDEAKLGETSTFLDDTQRDRLTKWWLDVRPNANTPNWDLVSTCTIDGKKGLVLIEAKAHEGELSKSGKAEPETDNGRKNHARIRQAIKDANLGLMAGSQLMGWSLSVDSHYQLCNRFAWTWKVASLGVPVVLVYLGFLNAVEMDYSGRTILTSDSQWNDCMLDYANGVVPTAAWNKTINIDSASLLAIVRSVDVAISASGKFHPGKRDVSTRHDDYLSEAFSE